ncbi:TPA: hypothetical protein KDY52_001301 [Vibrio parahaemolyticus]|nr:hypothetical protein [Vibrio parahaemolyticus]MDG2639197.1 hypothetical protein [Vibrio parahaemolyticus]HBC3457132.1 hypothetical protein [Vibrio parahaemolyticus]
MSVAAYRINLTCEAKMHSTNNILTLQDSFDESPDLTPTLGISPTIFRDAIQSGLILYKSTTKFHPVTAGGSRAWEEIVASFRLSVVENYQGWKAIQENGMPILVNPPLGITIVITSGDTNTGLTDSLPPKTKNAKGQVTENYVGKNYDLFGSAEDTPQIIKIDSNQTWVFLYTVDKSKKEIRFELSLPTDTSISGAKGKIKICDWQKRVIFPPVSFDDIPDDYVPGNDFTDDSDFFSIEKK